MFIEIKGIKTHYEVSGLGYDVILLPGWGQNTEMMKAIANNLVNYFKVYNLDWPNFSSGLSGDLNRVYDTDDYCEYLKEFIDRLEIKKPIIIGHSFGCRIAIRYAAKYQNVYKMVLTGAAGLKPKRGIDYYFKVYSYKLMKKIIKLPLLHRYQNKFTAKAGSTDYQNATGYLKETFVKVVNENIEPLLGQVTCETLLVFGENDQATPLWMGKVMEEKMQNAALVVFENDDHYAYFNQANRFNLVLNAFFKEDIHESIS